jgi:hypothetical protein
MTNNEFMTWLETEWHKHFLGKPKYVNEHIYTIRMSDKDFCLNLLDNTGGCVCIPSAKETFVPTRHLAKKIKSIEYDNEEPECPLIIIKTEERKGD